MKKNSLSDTPELDENPDSPGGGVDRVEGHEVVGSFDACDETSALGWAREPSNPDHAVSVTLWVDGRDSGSSQAQLYRADLQEQGMGHGRHAYCLPLPRWALDGTEHVVEVKTTAAGSALSGGPRHFRSTSSRPAATGTLDAVSAAGAVGWAAHADRDPEALIVELLIDGQPVVEGRADQPRDDLAVAGYGQGRHAYSLPLPPSVFDDQWHEVAVRAQGASTSLNGSPVRLKLGPCEQFDCTRADDVLAKHAAADRVLDHVAAQRDSELRAREHTTLLAMQQWLDGQPFKYTQERTQLALRRLTAVRSHLDLDGLTAPARFEGRLGDRWEQRTGMQVQLLEAGQVVAEGSTDTNGRFVFDLPPQALDGAAHEFSLKVPAFGATLGPWSFLLLRPGVHDDEQAASVGDTVWGQLPRTSRAVTTASPKPATRVELTGAVAKDLLAHGGPAPGRSKRLLDALTEHADALGEAGDWAAALQAYRQALALRPEHANALLGEVRALTGLGQDDEALRTARSALSRFPDDAELLALVDRLVGHERTHESRVVAFYLPQFHPVPENNEWWGEGFTEWTNVAAAEALFEGHLQPRRPTSLGYYDLRLPDTANAQFELARRYGIDGFCYYYYWFEGRRILDRPLQDLVDGRTGPFPFCICWANEDWTRSWDGASGEVLLAQNHSEASDFEFIRDLAPLLRHPDYIRVNGRPMVLIYRADKLASPARTVARWRQWCRDEGIGELHLCAVQSFGFDDPRPLGFDAAVEFPPHCLRDRYTSPPYLEEMRDLPGLVPGFAGSVLSYASFAKAALARPREAYTLHRTAMVAWDNTARRQKTAHVFHGFSVDRFEDWVEHNLRCAAREQPDGLCFINAWNEWAEGSVMEPDAHFGYEILEGTRRARARARLSLHATYWTAGRPRQPEDRLQAREQILMVGHDAHLHGAQTNLLNMTRCLRRELQMDVSILLLDGGVLVPEYERVGPTQVIGRDEHWRSRAEPLLAAMAARGIRKAICNTVVTGEMCDLLKTHGFRVVGLVHELPNLIEANQLQAHCWRMADRADALVFASQLVAREFSHRYWPRKENVLVAPQGISLNPHVKTQAEARAKVRKSFKLSQDTLLVMGCGYGDTRKGFDLFVQMAGQVHRLMQGRSVAFVWVGKVAEMLAAYANSDLERLDLHKRFFITGQTREAALYFAACDVFALPSREDPFPSVVMEAFDVGMPVVGFDGAGGFVDIVNEHTGALVPYLDVDKMSQAIAHLLSDETKRLAIGRHNHQLCREQFTYAPYMRKLLALLSGVTAAQVGAGHSDRLAWLGQSAPPRVSVVVPNFNYAEYLELRLRTIAAQTLAPCEIIVLDDASTDASLALIRAFAAESSIPVHVVESQANSGSPFPQWARGLEMAQGDLVWIAEADDYCEPTLLETLVAEFVDEQVVMAWADSVMVDEHGHSHGAQYKAYYEPLYGAQWTHPFKTDGRQLIDDCLLTENVLPNASAIVFRRSAVQPQDLKHLVNHRFSGDWWLWIMLASRGAVAYTPEPLNYHRRHQRSVMGQVLRAGAGLMQETLAFYQRLLDHMPDLFSARSLRSVHARMEQLYRMFPEQTLLHPRLQHNPAYAAAYSRLVQAGTRAAASAPVLRGRAVFVVSADRLMQTEATWVSALEGLKLRLPASLSWQVVALQAPAAAEPGNARSSAAELRAWSRKHPGLTWSEATPAGLAQSLGLANQAAPVVVATHGLPAHCLVQRLEGLRATSWWLVAGNEFDALLDGVPEHPEVDVDTLEAAIACCAHVVFTTDAPGHALARMARHQRRPLQRVRPDTSKPVRTQTGHDTLRVVALASQAQPEQWQAAARLLDSPDRTGRRVDLTLLYLDGMDDAQRRLHDTTPSWRVEFTCLLPPMGEQLAHVYIASDKEGSQALFGRAGLDVILLQDFLDDPVAALGARLKPLGVAPASLQAARLGGAARA
jgi:glycosyltransferase involved in cell wall biosynthesis/tetratricopeptide (TPR) repeat protein